MRKKFFKSKKCPMFETYFIKIPFVKLQHPNPEYLKNSNVFCNIFYIKTKFQPRPKVSFKNALNMKFNTKLLMLIVVFYSFLCNLNK